MDFEQLKLWDRVTWSLNHRKNGWRVCLMTWSLHDGVTTYWKASRIESIENVCWKWSAQNLKSNWNKNLAGVFRTDTDWVLGPLGAQHIGQSCPEPCPTLCSRSRSLLARRFTIRCLRGFEGFDFAVFWLLTQFDSGQLCYMHVNEIPTLQRENVLQQSPKASKILSLICRSSKLCQLCQVQFWSRQVMRSTQNKYRRIGHTKDPNI